MNVQTFPPVVGPASPRMRRLTDAQIRVIRMSVARACSDAEFDHFIAVAERTGLDPLRRQISAIVLNERDNDKRSMLPLVTIDGLRSVAARQGDYRPMEGPPLIDIDPGRVDPRLNPLGVVRAEVRVWRRFDREWFSIVGEAWWDEYAALFEQAGDEPGARVRTLAQNWRRMGRVLIAKCAEAQALRRGWPEDLSGLYGEEELHRAELEQILAHERVQRAEGDKQQRALAGARALLLSFAPAAPLETINRAEIGLRLAAFIATAPDAACIEAFQARNQDALRTFWEWAPGDALDIKRQAERAIARFNRSAESGDRKPTPKRRGKTSAKEHGETSAKANRTTEGRGGAKARTRARRGKVPAPANQGAQATAP